MAEENALAAYFVPLSPSLCFPLPYKSPAVFTRIIQIGFPRDEGMREDKEVAGVILSLSQPGGVTGEVVHASITLLISQFNQSPNEREWQRKEVGDEGNSEMAALTH